MLQNTNIYPSGDRYSKDIPDGKYDALLIGVVILLFGGFFFLVKNQSTSMSKKELIGLVMMGLGNIAAIYSATCSSYFSTDKFAENPEDKIRAINAGIYGLILSILMIGGVFLVYRTPTVAMLLFVIAAMMYILYYDVVTDKLGLWNALMGVSTKIAG